MNHKKPSPQVVMKLQIWAPPSSELTSRQSVHQMRDLKRCAGTGVPVPVFRLLGDQDRGIVQPEFVSVIEELESTADFNRVWPR